MKRTTEDRELYERCINLAIKLSEASPTYTISGHQYLGSKHHPDDILKLADKLYAKIKGAK